MKSRKKSIVYSALLSVIVLCVSYFYAHIDKNTYIYDRTADTGTYYGTGIISGSDEISQTFVAKENSIDGINLKVSMAGNVEQVIMHYTLVDRTSGESYKGSIPVTELENNKFNQLSIDTISNTKGKQFALIVSSENADAQNGFSLYAAPGSETEQHLMIRENEAEGTLVVRTISHGFNLETFIVFIGIAAFIIVFMKVLYKSFK